MGASTISTRRRFSTRSVLRSAYGAALVLTIGLDGAAHPLEASVSALLFGLLLVAVGFFSTDRNDDADLLPSIAMAVVVAIIAIVAVEVRWDPSGTLVDPSWSALAEVFGERGGTLSVNRLQPLWELPGAIMPFVAFAAAVPLYRSRADADGFWVTAALIGSAFAAYGLAQWLLFPTWHFGERRHYLDSLSGFYVNRNVAAALLVMTAGATLIVLDRLLRRVDPRALFDAIRQGSPLGPHRRRILLFGSLFLLQVLALLSTKSRAGALLGVATLGVLVVLGLRRAFLRFGRVPSSRALVIAALLGGVALSLLGAQLGRRLDLQGFDDARWCLYPSVVELIGDAWPWGVGLGGFVTAFPSHRPTDCALVGVVEKAHDTYLQGLATIGLAFPILALVVLGVIVPALWRRMRRAEHPEAATVVLCLGAELAVHSLVDFPLEIPGNAVLYATFVAAALVRTDPK